MSFNTYHAGNISAEHGRTTAVSRSNGTITHARPPNSLARSSVLASQHAVEWDGLVCIPDARVRSRHRITLVTKVKNTINVKTFISASRYGGLANCNRAAVLLYTNAIPVFKHQARPRYADSKDKYTCLAPFPRFHALYSRTPRAPMPLLVPDQLHSLLSAA